MFHPGKNFRLVLTGLSAALLALVSLAPAPATGSDAPQPAALPANRQVGQRLGNFTLEDAVTKRPYALYGFAGKKAAVLVFLGTECPLARLYAPRLVELAHQYRARGVAFLGIFSNAHESEAEIAGTARQYGIDFPVLRDPGNVVADLALAERTPETIVLDGRARVCYRGAIDDQYGARAPQGDASA